MIFKYQSESLLSDKFSKENGSVILWVFIDEIDHFEVGGKFEQKTADERTEEVPTLNLTGMVSEYEKDKVPVKIVFIRRRNGDCEWYQINGVAYLMSDTGKTIEKI